MSSRPLSHDDYEDRATKRRGFEGREITKHLTLRFSVFFAADSTRLPCSCEARLFASFVFFVATLVAKRDQRID